MRERARKRLELRIIIVIVIFVSTAFTPLRVNASEEEKHFAGISVYGGKKMPEGWVWHVPDKLDWISTNIYLKYGKYFDEEERWQIYLEGNFGKYKWMNIDKKIEDVYSFGICVMTSYELFKFFKKFSCYFNIGGGLGYWNRTPDDGFVNRNSVIGIFKYGIGVKIPLGEGISVSIACQDEHYSGIREVDLGCNNRGLLLSFEFRF